MGRWWFPFIKKATSSSKGVPFERQWPSRVDRHAVGGPQKRRNTQEGIWPGWPSDGLQLDRAPVKGIIGVGRLPDEGERALGGGWAVSISDEGDVVRRCRWGGGHGKAMMGWLQEGGDIRVGGHR